ncbi:hypothetical protein [Peribacillus sp. YIM B13477]|uniref:hypothetical protein n=1 Tax=Peribacillus sp. YIM B13477 TaxID=3366300 RepID=UPI00366C5AE9
MPELSYIGINLLMIVMSILNFLLTKSQNESIVELIRPLIMVLLLINLLIWIAGFAQRKIDNWLEKRRQKNYSLLTWLGDTNVSLDLFDDLSNIKTFNHEDFYKNYMMVKNKIKEYFPTNNQLKGLKFYLETRNESSKFNAIFKSTQTILIAIIIPSILTMINFSLKNSTIFLSTITFVAFWFLLLRAIDSMGKETDKMKVMLRLVNGCIEESG